MERDFPDASPSRSDESDWLSAHIVPDARFAKAYAAFSDERRALVKSLIARHFELARPASARSRDVEERFELFRRRTRLSPVSFVILFIDHEIDAPALFLAALMPALCSRAERVLVCRAGKRADVPDVVLMACELAGQERVAALGPVLMQRLIVEAAGAGEPGVVLYPRTQVFHKLLAQAAVREALDGSNLRLAGLLPPRACGIWRDAPDQFPPVDISLLYGPLGFEVGGVAPVSGAPAPDAAQWAEFRSPPRDLLLAPAARAGDVDAAVCVAEGCLGQWAWPEVTPELFHRRSQIFAT